MDKNTITLRMKNAYFAGPGTFIGLFVGFIGPFRNFIGQKGTFIGLFSLFISQPSK